MRLFSKIFSFIANLSYYVAIKLIDMYVYIRQNLVNNKEHFSVISSHGNIDNHNSDNNLFTYIVNIDNEKYKVNLFKCPSFNLSKNEWKDVIKKKNLITHCCLIDTLDNYILDITEEFRTFCFYLKEEDSVEYSLIDKIFNAILIKLNIDKKEELEKLRSVQSLKLILSLNNKELTDLSFTLQATN